MQTNSKVTVAQDNKSNTNLPDASYPANLGKILESQIFASLIDLIPPASKFVTKPWIMVEVRNFS